MIEARKPFPPELLDRIRETGANAILAGCTVEESIELARQTVEQWRRENPGYFDD